MFPFDCTAFTSNWKIGTSKPVNYSSLMAVKIGVFCLKYEKSTVFFFGQIGAFFCLVSIGRGRGQGNYFHR